jgi:hypothetical protein
MSGRLIILPKKTYCPWKPENVERVLRDERLERQRIEEKEAEARELESRQRLAQLKGAGGADSSSSSQQQEQQGHVNLFEPQEQAAMEASLAKEIKKEPKGIMPVRLDSVVVETNHDRPFYIRDSVARNDGKLKARMDPMKAFTKHDACVEEGLDGGERKRRSVHVETEGDERSLRKKSRRRKRSSRQEDDCSDSQDSSTRSSTRRRKSDKKRRRRRHSKSEKRSSASTGASMEELRQRRREREQKESQREAALQRQAGSGNDRHRRYQDQFFPSLSRR